MSDLTRREALGLFAGIPLVAAGLSPAQVSRATLSARQAIATATFTPAFFTASELETVKILADLVIPRDTRSGSATDAGVPEFMDFILNENSGMQTPFRGGLAWINTEARERFGKEFTGITEPQRKQILDDIAWPRKAKPEFSQGVAFFNRFRDLTASGFFSSKIGVADLQYIGNEFVMEWKGCPPAALAKLGVSYS
ncbi:MAG TPA: gluconate 2-dehydrogenase subunit 3 family protein [Gemmatimonadales bacterium]|nr:gluconate 2-dehydrogenase subunit 3 family protein [Gemmatimonadales bacterium]